MKRVWRGLDLRLLALSFGAVVLGISASIVVARVFFGRVASSEEASLVVELESDTPSTAQVYFDTGRGFNEAESAQAMVTAGEGRPLVFAVRSPEIRAIRLDPLRCGGSVVVVRWWLEAHDGRSRIELPVAAMEPAYHVASTELRDGRLHVVIPAEAYDPQLLFAPPEPIRVPEPRFPWMSSAVGCVGLLIVMGARSGWREALPSTVPGWVMAAVLIGVAGYLLHPIHRALDYPLWDEANYLAWGRAAWSTHDLGGISGAPVYLAWYAVITAAFDGGAPVFVTHYVVKLAIVAALGALTARWFDSTWAGLCAGLVTALSAWNLTFPLLVYQAAWIWFLLAIVVADRSRLGAVGFLALAALTRLEYVLALGIFSVVAMTARLRLGLRPLGPHAGRRVPWAWCLPLVAAALLAAHVREWNPGTSRSWFAFQQHYALGRVESGQDRDIDPMIEYPRLVGRDFAGAGSLREAYAVNATGVRGHVQRNLVLAARRVGEFFVTVFGGVSGWWIAMAGLIGSIGVAVAMRGEADAGAAAFLQRHRWSVACALSGFAAVSPGLIIYAKTAYLLPIVPLVWLLAAIVARGLRAVCAAQHRPKFIHGAILLGVVAAGIAAAPRPFSGRAPARPVHDTVALIRELHPDGAAILGVSASSYAHYLGPAYEGIEPLASVRGNAHAPEASLRELVGQHRPDLILVTSAWSSLHSFDPDGLRALEAQGWRRRVLPDGALYLAPDATAVGDP